MNVSSHGASSPRQKVFDEAAILVTWAASNHKVVPAGREGERLYRENPGCDMSESGVIEYIVRLAREKRLTIDTSR